LVAQPLDPRVSPDPSDRPDSSEGAVAHAARVALSLVVLPHELAHLLALAPWGRGLRLDLAPPLDETRGVPLARVGGRFDPAIPLSALRLAAVAPTVVYPALAVVVGVGVTLSAPVALVLTALLAVWAAPSTGDLTVLVDARAVRETGSLDVRGPSPRLADPLSAVLSVVVTLVVAAGLLL
jgi:hypothetical protein